MKKRIFALMLALCLALAMMPVPAFAEGEVTEPSTETVVPEEGKKPGEPVAPEETKKSEEPVIPEETKKSEEPVIPEETKKPEEPLTPAEPSAAEKVQALIDTLPETVTAENRAEVEAQLAAIDEAKAPLGDEALATLNMEKYNAAVAALHALEETPGAEVPKTMETKSLEGANVIVTKPFTYDGTLQTLTASDVTVTLADGTTLTADNFTLSATAQTVPGTYSFTVTGSGNYTGTASGTWRIGKGTLGDQTIHVKMRTGGQIFVGLTDSLPDLGPNGGLDHGISSSEGIDVQDFDLSASVIYIAYSGAVQDPSEETVSVLMMSDYYEDFTVKVIVHFVNEGEGVEKTLTVSMESWNVSARPNKPSITGLPDTPYNYKVTYARKDGTALTGVPTEIGEYQVTVSCEDLENNTYSGTANFSVFLSVSFDPNGGTLQGSEYTIQTTTGKLSTLPVPDWTGHTFQGWFTDRTEGNLVDEDTVYTGNTPLYARWKTNTYTISFDANGGEGTMDTLPMTYDKADKLTAIGFTREGYRFTDWNTQADGTGSVSFANEAPVSNLTTVDGGEVTLYAQWVKVIDRVDLSLSGHGLDKSVEQVKVTTADDISFAGSFPTGWGITKSTSDLTPLNGELFRADTQYYLFVTFSAKEGCTLEGLKKENVLLDGKTAQSLTVEQGTVTALFRLPVIYTIETSAGKNGTIDPEGTVAVFEGQDVEIKITPNSGYVVYRLTVDGTNEKTARTYTFKNVQKSHTIHARFLKNGDNAKTGDSFPMGIALGAVTLSAAALAALFFLRKRKQTR